MKKLYWDDPYLTKCTSVVTSIEESKIKLDQTIFYAFSGGQASDFGTIGGINVVEAVEEDKENISYLLDNVPNFNIGDEVEVVINEERRRKIRNLHSATHIVSYFVEEKLGKLECIGSNVSVDKARLDYIFEGSISEHLMELEEKINLFILEENEVTIENDETDTKLRLWICKEMNMPCGGTHVKNTKEIGKVKLKRKN